MIVLVGSCGFGQGWRETAQYDPRTIRLVLQGRIHLWLDAEIEYKLGDSPVGNGFPKPDEVTIHHLFAGRRRFRKVGKVIRYDDPNFPSQFEVPSAVSTLAPDGFVGWLCSLSATHGTFIGVTGSKPDLREVVQIADVKADRWMQIEHGKNTRIGDLKTQRNYVLAAEQIYVPGPSPELAGQLLATKRSWIYKLGTGQEPKLIEFDSLREPRVLGVRDDVILLQDGDSLYRAEHTATGPKNLRKLVSHDAIKLVRSGVENETGP